MGNIVKRITGLVLAFTLALSEIPSMEVQAAKTKLSQYDKLFGFSDGIARVEKGETIVEGIKEGFIDKEGNEIVKPEYDNAHDFSEGLAAVVKDLKWGFIDKTGNETIALPIS